MNDQHDDDDKDTAGSGSRWEPAGSPPPQPAREGHPAASTPITTDLPRLRPAAFPASSGGSGGPSRAVLAGTAAALVLVGGFGGFALGSAAAGGGAGETAVVQGGDPGSGDVDRDDDGVAGPRPGFGGGPGAAADPGGSAAEDPTSDDPARPGTT